MSASQTRAAVIRLDSGRVLPVRNRLALGRQAQGHVVVARAGGEEIDLGVQDATVSRDHAVLFWSEGALWAQDRGSAWGTWMDDQRLPTNGSRREGAPVAVPEQATLRLGARLTLTVERLSDREIAPEVTTSQFVAMAARLSYRDFARFVALSDWAREMDGLLARSVTMDEVSASCEKAFAYLRPEEQPHQALRDLLARLDAQLRRDERLDDEQTRSVQEVCKATSSRLAGEWLRT